MRQTRPELIGFPLSAKTAPALSITCLAGAGAVPGAAGVWADAAERPSHVRRTGNARNKSLEKDVFNVCAITERVPLTDSGLRRPERSDLVLHEIRRSRNEIFQGRRTEDEFHLMT